MSRSSAGPGVDLAALRAWAARASTESDLLPGDATERSCDLALARLAATVAARRHGRPASSGEAPRPLQDVALLVGSGGVLRHSPPDDADAVLRAVLADHGGGWRPPADARTRVDTAYLLLAAGLLAPERPDLARAVAARIL